MKTFGGTTPQEHALSKLIHDHANATSLIGGSLKIIKRESMGGNRGSVEEWIKIADEAVTRAINALDEYIKLAQNDFN